MKVRLLNNRYAEERIARLGRGALSLRTAVSETVENALTASRHMVKLGFRAIEDAIDDSARRIKRHPFRSVAIAAGAGAVIGWLVSRKARR